MARRHTARLRDDRLRRLLLDSHVFLWYSKENSPLPASAVEMIRKHESVFVSAASIWELTIRIMSGKLDERRSLLRLADEFGFASLPVTPVHATAISALPQPHRDPFDRLLLAQAKVEDLTLVTHDDVLAHYGVAVLLV